MIEAFFDCSSPWTYLAFHNLRLLAGELGETITWRPILVGGVFNAVNPSVYAGREHPVTAKALYMLKDLADWSREAGLAIVMPPTVFPVNSVKVMRACVALEAEGRLEAFAQEAFEAYWSRDEDISREEVVAELYRRSGADAERVLADIRTDAVKARLRANTDALIGRGGFGSPTMFVGDDMYFGNDRLALVRAAVLKARGAASARPG